MSTNFTEKFAPSIVSVLGCHDRVIFKGHLPFGRDEHLNGWVDGCLKMRRMDFLPFVEKQSQTLVDHAKAQAAEAGVPYQPLQGRPKKEKLVQDLLRKCPQQEGLVTVLQVMETCRTVKLRHGQGRPRLVFARGRSASFITISSIPNLASCTFAYRPGFPTPCRSTSTGTNGWPGKCCTRSSALSSTTMLLLNSTSPSWPSAWPTAFPELPWVKILNRWVRRVNPLLGRSWFGKADYYWVIDQAEYSTDVLFQSRAKLAELYPRLLQHALLCFSAQDILTFLGRRLHPRFDGKVLTDCKMDRLPGARIKHRMKNNWLKMYDKFGQILRIETVINQPREFKVRRYRLRAGQHRMRWCPMNKGVANFYRYHAVARAANARYLNALAVVDVPCATAKQVDRVSKPAPFGSRRRRGLNLLHPDEQRLFRRPPWRLAPERLPQSRPGPGAFRLRNGFRRGKAASQSSRLSSASTAARSWSDRQGPS